MAFLYLESSIDPALSTFHRKLIVFFIFFPSIENARKLKSKKYVAYCIIGDYVKK